MRRIVYETCEAIWNVLQSIVMPEPNRKMWEQKQEEFSQKWNFPNCIGAIDGKHVVFQKPKRSGSLFFNYKKTCSIVLLAVFDANYKFTLIDVGAYGKNSDGGILSRCSFGKKFFKDDLGFPPDKPLPGTAILMPHVLVGDEAFPLNKHLMRPYPGEQLRGNEDKKVYNYRLSRARNVSENGFGILSKKFRIYQRRLEITPEHLDTVVLATCCLHNFLRSDSEVLFAETCEEELSGNSAITDITHVGGSFSGTALLVRERFKNYFNSQFGSVDWQLAIVRQGLTSQNRDN